MSARPHMLSQIRRAVHAVEQRSGDQPQLLGPAIVQTGWPELDATLPGRGLRCGAAHEWFGCERTAHDRESRFPLAVLTHLAWRAILTNPGSWAVWIGSAVQPDGHALVRDDHRQLLQHSVFVESSTAAERLWAADLAARCPAVQVVIADARHFDMAATRRLQLAAKAGHVLMLLAREAEELAELSAAATRWRVEPTVSTSSRPRWAIQGLRCKAAQGSIDSGSEHHSALVEWNRAEGLVGTSAGLGDRAPDQAKPPSSAARIGRRHRHSA